MIIEKIIVEYIESHRRITIPALGTIIHTGADSPLLFVEFANDDDQTLRSLIAARCDISDIEAVGMLEEFVSQAHRALSSSGEYSIGGAILLVRGDDGVISIDNIKSKLLPDNVVQAVRDSRIEAKMEIEARMEEVEECDEIEYDEQPAKPRPDIVLIVSIAAVAVAIIVVIYSLFVNWQMGNISLPEPLDSALMDLFGDGLQGVERVE